MPKGLFTRLLSWICLLGFIAFSAAQIEKQSFEFSRPWLLMLFRLGFAAMGTVLMLRFYSLRIQKSWEGMVAAYSQATGSPLPVRRRKDIDLLNMVLIFGLVFSGLAAFAASLLVPEKPGTLQACIWLDAAAWVSAWTWLAKSVWLGSLGRREQLKMSLDDLRSKRTPPSDRKPPAFSPPSLSAKLMFALFILAGIGLLLRVSAGRLRRVPEISAKAATARCLEKTWVFTRAEFDKSGKFPDTGATKAPDCLPGGSEQYEFSLTQEGGGIGLQVWEAKASDPLHNGDKGDQGLRLSADGKWVELSRRRARQ